MSQPPGTDVVASSLFTPYAALAWTDGSAISFQFHPEFSPAFAKALIEQRYDRVPDPDAAIASLDAPERQSAGRRMDQALPDRAAAFISGAYRIRRDYRP